MRPETQHTTWSKFYLHMILGIYSVQGSRKLHMSENGFFKGLNWVLEAGYALARCRHRSTKPEEKKVMRQDQCWHKRGQMLCGWWKELKGRFVSKWAVCLILLINGDGMLFHCHSNDNGISYNSDGNVIQVFSSRK